MTLPLKLTRRGLLGLFAGAAAAAALPALPKQPEPAPIPPPAPEPAAPLYDFKVCGAYNPKHDCECYRHPGHAGTHGCYVAERPGPIHFFNIGDSIDLDSGHTITYVEWPRGLYAKDIDGVYEL